VLAGNTADCTTLRDMLCKIEAQYGKARRIWVMLCDVRGYVELAVHGTGFSEESSSMYST
jgi:hypothetical protein